MDFLPSPRDIGEIKARLHGSGEPVEIKPDENDEFAALVFKVVSDRHVGRLAFIRVYSGQLSAGSYVYHVNRERREHVGRLLRMHANHRQEIPVIKGDIAVIGLKTSAP